jgi:hypothetical protein
MKKSFLRAIGIEKKEDWCEWWEGFLLAAVGLGLLLFMALLCILKGNALHA